MLKKYLLRLHKTILSRHDIELETLIYDDLGQRGSIEGLLKFYDGSKLDFDETVTFQNQRLVKLRYAYHYQNEAGVLMFRYDNAPHYPQISTFPHHKHVGAMVEAATPPDLADVLQEIAKIIYP